MRIKTLSLKNFCGYQSTEFSFGDFTCLFGPNGIGKTTVLHAVSLLASSLDFASDQADTPGGWKPTITPEQRLRAFLNKNVRNVDDGGKAFEAAAIFEHEGKDYSVILNENGFLKNELVDQPFWWVGLCYFAKFDADMVNFQLRYDLWPKFKRAYEGITGFQVEPDVYTETDLKALKKQGECTDYVIGFDMLKPDGKVHSRRGSAGERKIAKALSQIVNLEESRQPNIVLCDNLEMHVHHKRHLKMVEELKTLFLGKQVISTTHSSVLIEKYEPKEDMIDIELKKYGKATI